MDAEEDDHSGTALDIGEGPAWLERHDGAQTTENGRSDFEDDEPSDLVVLRRQIKRIRRTRCVATRRRSTWSTVGDWTDYQLRSPLPLSRPVPVRA